MTGQQRWVRLGWWVLGVVVVLGSAALRESMDGRAELVASDAAWSSGDAAGATVHARHAAWAFVPGASHVPQAYGKLRQIAEQSEARGDTEAALFAWRAIRAAAIGSRSWLTSHDAERDAADAAISRITVALRSASSATRPTPSSETSRAYRTMMAADPAPPLGWGLLFLAGAGLWVVAGIRLARRGFDAEGNLVSREARTTAALAVSGLAAWIAGLLWR